MRLTEIGRNLGLVNNEKWEIFTAKRHRQETVMKLLQTETVTAADNMRLAGHGMAPVNTRVYAFLISCDVQRRQNRRSRLLPGSALARTPRRSNRR